MIFETKYEWLKKQVKVVEGGKLVFPINEVIVPLCIIEEQLKKYDDKLDLIEKIKILQTLGLNLRSVDVSYFNFFENVIRCNNPYKTSKNLFSCKGCYDSSISAKNLRKSYNSRMVYLNNLNNKEIIHAIELKKLPNTKYIKILEEYFYLITGLDLTGTPELQGVKKIKCKSCVMKKCSTCGSYFK